MNNQLQNILALPAREKIKFVYARIEEKNGGESIGELAKIFGISYFHLSHLCAGKLKLAIYTARIRRAKELILLRNSIKYCAFTSGFGSISQFNRTFREIIGVSPTMWKNTNM